MGRPEFRFQFSGAACLLLSLMVLFLPLPWLCAMLVAAAVHEGCHWAALRLLGGAVSAIRMDLFAAQMEFDELSRGREILCALAGPVGSLSLLLLAGRFPRLAVCGLVQGIYNLLPLYPMDGGRILCGLCHLWYSPPKAQKCFRIIEGIACFFCGVLSVLFVFWGGIGLLSLGFLILVAKSVSKWKHTVDKNF